MADYEFCRTAVEGRVLTITIHRPEVMNALHTMAHAELARVFDDFAVDPELWVAVITGAGERAFCTGSDLKFLASGADYVMPDSGYAGLTERYDLDKPVIAAVNGAALGGGMEIALACDLIVAAEDAVFGLPEPRVGLAAMAGGLHRLVRQIPLKRAMGLILTGQSMTAAEAFDLGLVNEVVPQGGAVAAARRWAEAILDCAPLAVQASKQVAMRGLDAADLAAAVAAEYPAAVHMTASEDAAAGPRAFAEKRPQQWLGR